MSRNMNWKLLMKFFTLRHVTHEILTESFFVFWFIFIIDLLLFEHYYEPSLNYLKMVFIWLLFFNIFDVKSQHSFFLFCVKLQNVDRVKSHNFESFIDYASIQISNVKLQLLFTNWFMASDKVKNERFFFLNICVRPGCFICVKIRKGLRKRVITITRKIS